MNKKTDEPHMYDIATRAAIGVEHGTEVNGAVVSPIYQVSTFSYPDSETGRAVFAGEETGYLYTRLSNPTIDNFEKNLANLECAEDAVAFASGMAAVMAVILSCAQSGENVVAPRIIYGGTYGALRDTLPRMGVKVNWIDKVTVEQVSAAIDDKTRLVITETPANPNLSITDITAISEVCHKRSIPMAVDNTFATFAIQQPILLGADIVLHSCTKYIGGHGDTLGGVVAGSKTLMAGIRKQKSDVGGCQSPFNAWLLNRGLKTLPLRMERHSQNAAIVADYFTKHPKVARVFYPGLASHPGHDIAARQMKAFGGMVSIELPGGLPTAARFLDSLHIITQAVSLGDVSSLACHPSSTTHHAYTSSELERAGLSEDLTRISVGIENINDLLDDLDQALAKV